MALVKPGRVVETMGVAILIAFVSSAFLLALSPTDTGQRGLAFGAVSAASCLEVLWVLAALFVLVSRWRTSTLMLKMVFVLNGAIVVLLARDFYLNR
jgi:hypothetical protein